jgi:outer membrane protein assembly factor BamA
MANAAVFSMGFSRGWPEAARDRRNVTADLSVRAGSDSLESDLVYTRILGQGRFRQRWGRHRVIASAMAGRVSGDAPMFERFTLGDSETLRGWDKYDIAPLGANRMVHASGEYHYRSLFLFLDAGSLWDEGTDRQARFSAGGGQAFGPVFWTVGFPLNTDEVRAVFTMGIRFSTINMQKD